jgi:hypothetical protein
LADATSIAWSTEARQLREQVERLVAGQTDTAALATGLREVRAAIGGLQAEVARAGTSVESRVDARVRAALESWNAESRALRARLEQVAAARADDGTLTGSLTDVRTTLERLRADVGRLDGTLDRRLDARVQAAERSWDAEAAVLRTRMEALTEQLAQQARAAEDPLGLRAAAAALARRLAALQAAADRVPGLQGAAALVGALAWALGGARPRPGSTRA